jgi:uncharacterized protein YkwD
LGRDIGDDERRVYNAVNNERAKRDVGPLEWSDRMAQVARRQSERMLVHGFFGHEDPEYGGLTSRLALHGIQWSRCGENLFSEKGIEDPVPIAVISWRYSTKGHFKTMMDPEFTDTGVGIAATPDGYFYVTQTFLAPAWRR